MASLRDRVAQAEFEVETGLDPAEIRAAGLRAAEAGKRFMNNTVSEDEVTDSGIRYVIKGPGGIVKQMTVIVHWSEIDEGRRRVTLSIPSFTTLQPTILGFIPSGPKNAPALKSGQRFSEALRVELAQK
jgi:hypothetical protein